MKKLITCAFTGHRPKLLPWNNDENDAKCLALKSEIKAQIEKAIAAGYKKFLCGMAIGSDIYFAELVLELKKTHPFIELIPVIPYELQYDRWQMPEQRRYFNILAQCTVRKVISNSYTPTCLMERNRYLADNSSRLLAVYNGFGKSGTKNTIEYAQKIGIEVIIIKLMERQILLF